MNNHKLRWLIEVNSTFEICEKSMEKSIELREIKKYISKVKMF